MKVAVAQWQIGAPASFEDFAARVERELAAVAAQGAQFAVLPEYLALELAHAFGPAVYGDLHSSLRAVDDLYADWRALFAGLARRHGMHVVAGSFLRRQGEAFRNRALLFTPDGRVGAQDKLRLTGYEKQAGCIVPGDALKVFDTEFGRVGINICYDVEFPLFARAQAEAGAALLLVPSCTDTEAGAWRVRIGCQARALESQLPVVCAVTAGSSDWSPALDVNTGRAAVYVPPDRGLPETGVLAVLDADAGWLLADVDVAAVRKARAIGQVGVAADWPGQLLPAVQRARLAGFEPA
ncbi:carbon-nitrogen hydrolase family protein [Dyella thiooxydans]|uniref:carbon-nitrogen hydrolase family protein n=1 Tax=Dyella thiooxydans TaxID=445710 RepID=UPI0007C4E28A|nr:carbon-nitrogen hydrolase family protein [Dyella thiooxydans]